jgi:hypothetical protein
MLIADVLTMLAIGVVTLVNVTRRRRPPRD